MQLLSSVHDLALNEHYFITLSKKQRPLQAKYLGAVKTKHNPDFYFRFTERKGFKETVSFFGINEIGVGSTPDEAKNNYAKFAIEIPLDAFENDDQIG